MELHADALNTSLQKVTQYTRRAEQLRTSQFVHALPDVPEGVGSLLGGTGAAAAPAPAEPLASASRQDVAAQGNFSAAGTSKEAAGREVAAGAGQGGAAGVGPSSAPVSSLKAGIENASAAIVKAKDVRDPKP